MADRQPADCTQTVDAWIASYPITESVFWHHGIDVAHAGARTVHDAARLAGSDPEVLCGVLQTAARVQKSMDTPSPRA